MIFPAADVSVWKYRELIYSLSRTIEINKVGVDAGPNDLSTICYFPDVIQLYNNTNRDADRHDVRRTKCSKQPIPCD
jgi:hypothetical protein